MVSLTRFLFLNACGLPLGISSDHTTWNAWKEAPCVRAPASNKKKKKAMLERPGLSKADMGSSPCSFLEELAAQPWVTFILSETQFLIFHKTKVSEEFPLCLSRLRTQLISLRKQVWPLASLSGLKIQCCSKLQRRSQMWLGSGVTVAVGKAGSCSSDVTLSLGNFHMLHRQP